MNHKLCKFRRVHLTRFRLVQRQSATVTAHTHAHYRDTVPFKQTFLQITFSLLADTEPIKIQRRLIDLSKTEKRVLS